MEEKMDVKEKENTRKIRAYSILAKGDTPKRVNKETFLIPSQSNQDKKYKVVHHENWKCNCPDFKHHNGTIRCKHIQAVDMWLNLRNTIMNEDALNLKEEMQNQVRCECGSYDVRKDGVRKNNNSERQRYKCRECGKRFVAELVKKHKASAKVIALSMDLYFKGLSYRKIADTIYQFYEIKVSHETIRRWVNKFMGKIRNYVDKLEPNVGDIWHIDEQSIKVNGENLWSWNALDEKSRFLIANEVTLHRSDASAKKVLAKAKEIVEGNPMYIITDGLASYPKAIRDVFEDVNHIGGVGIRDRINNNVLERYHGTYRERDKVMRGLETLVTAKEMNENIRVYYNFIRPHTALNGKTPSEMVGINLGLGRNKWMGLIEKSI